MKFKTFYALLILLMIGVQFSTAQNTGYAGKRLVIRADAVNGIKGVMSGVGMEYVLFERASLGLTLNRMSYNVAQRYGGSEYEQTLPDLPTKMPSKANVDERSLTLQGRIYFNGTNAPPAPNGLFFYSDLCLGQVDVDGQYYLELLEPSSLISGVNDQIVDYSLNNVDFLRLEAGFGRQRVFYDWFIIGLYSGVSYSRFFVNSGSDAEKVFSGAAKAVGANVIGYGGRLSGNSTSGNIGFSFKLQVGLLIL